MPRGGEKTPTRNPDCPGPNVHNSPTREKGLKRDALGLLSATMFGIASTAPAYSLAATLGLLVATAGIHSPAVILVAFVPMLFTAVAYRELNQANPDCGTTFTWAAIAIGPRVGWIAGWAIVVADVIVMANLAQIAAQYGFVLVNAESLVANTFWTTTVGVCWIAAMTAVCYLGIEFSDRIQQGLVAVELAMLAVLAAIAFTHVYFDDVGTLRPALSWFNPFGLGSFRALADGVLLAVFIYWGWDTAVTVNEESRERATVPGKAAILSTVILLVTYTAVTTAAQAFAGVGTEGIGLQNGKHSGDVLSVLGKGVFGSTAIGTVLIHLLLLMVLTSAAASTLTTILPTARTTLSMAVHRAIPERFARVHPRFLTPTWSTVGMGVASVAYYVLLTCVSSNLLGDTISSLGLMIAFYYGLTGFASAWYFRKVLTRSGRDLVMKGLLPVLGATALFAFLVKAMIDYAQPGYGSTAWHIPVWPHWDLGGVFLTGAGALLVGLALMGAWRLKAPSYFFGEAPSRAGDKARPLPTELLQEPPTTTFDPGARAHQEPGEVPTE